MQANPLMGIVPVLLILPLVALVIAAAMSLSVSSSSSSAGGEIPRRHTCEGEDLSPHLSWTDVPAGTREGLNDWRCTGYGGPCGNCGEGHSRTGRHVLV